MKILQVLALSVSVLVITSCTSFGKKYSPDNSHEVYYKGDGLDESNAKKLFDFLKTQGYFAEGHKATVQIVKAKDTVTLNFVYDKSKVDADREDKFHIFGGMIAKEVFSGTPLTIHLCDENLEMFKDLGYMKPTEAEVIPAENQ
jgi:hypothetical protein